MNILESYPNQNSLKLSIQGLSASTAHLSHCISSKCADYFVGEALKASYESILKVRKVIANILELGRGEVSSAVRENLCDMQDILGDLDVILKVKTVSKDDKIDALWETYKGLATKTPGMSATTYGTFTLVPSNAALVPKNTKKSEDTRLL